MLNSKNVLVAISALLLSFGALAQTANPEAGNSQHTPLGDTQLNASAVAADMPKTDSLPANCCETFVEGNRHNSASLDNKTTTFMCPSNVPVESLSSRCRQQLAKASTAPTVNGGAINEGNKGP